MSIELKGWSSMELRLKELTKIEEKIAPAMEFAVRNVIIPKVKAILKNDPRPMWGEHTFTANLLDNTDVKIVEGKHHDEVVFGYFVNYGLHIEPFPGERRIRPHSVDLETIKEWIIARSPGMAYGKVSPRTLSIYARRVKYKIERYGSRAYPIIMPVYNRFKNEMMGKFRAKLSDELFRLESIK